MSAWLEADALRMRALGIAAALRLPDCWLAAGFVRNLVWDRLHEGGRATPLADIDLVYFDPRACGEERDEEIEAGLKALAPELPWSVRNQARMHLRNGDAPYRSTTDAMSHWVEIETAVGARLNAGGGVELAAAFGFASLFALRITPNPRCRKPANFARRIREKQWLSRWPRLRVSEDAA
ncbi:MAG TPA: nucleotidyltransferase family protein [Paucimonas sp.]|nr:nucleotidyltransferase family protein [Paucimonas sp.]